MKKLFLISFALFLAFTTIAQTEVIRWYDINKPGVKRNFVFNPHGEPTGIYKLAIEYQGQYVRYGGMMKLLKQPLWPDVSFTDLIPALPEIPPKTIKVPNGTGGWTRVPNPEWGAALQARQDLLNAFNHQCMIPYSQVRLVIIQQFVYKTLDDGPDIRWELVDESKPYHNGRFTPIEVVPGKYSRTNEWKEYFAPGDKLFENLWRTYSNTCALKGGEKGLKYFVKCSK